MRVSLYNHTYDPLTTLYRVLTTCSGKGSNKSPEQMALMAYKLGHWSVFEFVDFTFTIEGLSRVALAQLTRHRMASYAVKTSRKNMDLKFNYQVPGTSEFEKNFEDYFVELETVYGTDNARYFLPQAQAVDLMMKINLRSLINFMQERLCSSAGSEIRELATTIREIVSPLFPELANVALQPKCHWLQRCPSGRNCITSPNNKKQRRD
jgi:thymidylate synthase (FAD)